MMILESFPIFRYTENNIRSIQIGTVISIEQLFIALDSF